MSPSDIESSEPPSDTTRLSDRDTSVAEEQIRRGDGPLAGPNPGKPVAQSAPKARAPTPPAPATPPEQSKTSETAAAQKKRELLPRPDVPGKDAFIEPRQKKQEVETEKIGNLDLTPRSDYLKNIETPQPTKKQKRSDTGAQMTKPFSRAAGSGAQFLGFNGNSDYLPNVRDGDITLLNAKADKYAVFVRRVAIRVFHLLKQYGWEYMRASDFRSLTKFTAVRATLSKDGSFLRVSLEGSSGNRTFDDIVKKAATDGANDPNPPPDALLPDGTYRFIFLARSWTQNAAGRRGGLQERRWLSLRTGLE